MLDYFALLEEERRPWIDPGRVKETFHRLSRNQHPDQRTSGGSVEQVSSDNADFAALNVAQQTLRDPRSRLRHLLSLEYPQVSVSGPSAVPSGLADLMFPVQSLLGQADAFLARKAAASSALSLAMLAGEGFLLQERAEKKLAALEAKLSELTDELQQFDSQRWYTRPADTASVLLGFYHGFAYLGRWTEQFRERLFQLAV